jgi:hypothetical protein
MVWRGCVLVISDALAAPLDDDELAGIVAHEMGHAYFMIEISNARKRGDRQAMKIVELKCDAVAMLSLKLLGHDPADHLRGLRRVNDLTRTHGFNPLDGVHPSIGERRRFAERYLKLLAASITLPEFKWLPFAQRELRRALPAKTDPDVSNPHEKLIQFSARTKL